MHQHEHTKAVLNRMSRAIGHMNAVKKMIEEGRDCSEVLCRMRIGLKFPRFIDHPVIVNTTFKNTQEEIRQF